MNEFVEDMVIPEDSHEVADQTAQGSGGELLGPTDLVDGPTDGTTTRKGKKTRRAEGTWNYTSAECVAAVWAAIASSESGETHQARLNERMATFYRSKTLELARMGVWKSPLSLASRGRHITVEESVSLRASYPEGIWKKAGELRREVQMYLAPKYAVVVEEGHSGWGMSEFVEATKKRSVHVSLFVCMALYLSFLIVFSTNLYVTSLSCR